MIIISVSDVHMDGLSCLMPEDLLDTPDHIKGYKEDDNELPSADCLFNTCYSKMPVSKKVEIEDNTSKYTTYSSIHVQNY